MLFDKKQGVALVSLGDWSLVKIKFIKDQLDLYQ